MAISRAAQAGQFLRGYREAGAAQVELRVDPVCGDVGHGPHHRRRLQSPDDGFPCFRTPLGRGAVLLCQTNAEDVAGDLGVALHADINGRGLRRQANPPCRPQCPFQDQELLRQGLLQIARREIHHPGVENHLLDPAGGRFRLPSAEEPTRKGLGVELPGADGQANNRHVNRGSIPGSAGRESHPRPPLLHDQVGVAAAEAKRADRRAPRPIGRPVFRSMQDAQGRPAPALRAPARRAAWQGGRLP